MSLMKNFVAGLLMLVAASIGMAEEGVEQSKQSPQQLIQTVTDEVLIAIVAATEYYDEDPERFYTEIEAIMAPVMDYQTFARTVMGRYGSSSAYRSLAKAEEKEQFKQRVISFTEVFRQTIMNTYGKGLMTFNGEEIDVLPLDEENQANFEQGRSVQVVQVIRGQDGAENKVYYKLKPNRGGEWKLRNVVINSINLGKVYQSQFASAVKDNDGDIDKAIGAWAEP